MATEVEDFIAHFGVKGMRWGVRKDKGSGSGGSVETAKPKLPASEDFTRARESQAKGSEALSNKELQDLVTRMNLEQQYSKLMKGPEVKKGKNFAEKALENYASEVMGKIIRSVATMAGQAILKAVLGKATGSDVKIPPQLLNVMANLVKGDK